MVSCVLDAVVALVLGLALLLDVVVALLEVVAFVVVGRTSGSGGGTGRIFGLGRLGAEGAGWSMVAGTALGAAGVVSCRALDLAFSRIGEGNVGAGIDEEESA